MEIRAARPEEMDAALALVASHRGRSPSEAVAMLRRAASSGKIDLQHLTVAAEGDRVEGAVLAILAPGRTAFVSVPGAVRRRREREVAVALLTHWRRAAADLGALLIQAFTEVNDRRHQAHLEEAGFEHLTDLIYLERDARLHLGEADLPAGLTWRPYGPGTHADFARVISLTYQDTLDCPRLSGLRSMDDVLAGHRAQGTFAPHRWWLVERDGAEAGCLLLNGLDERESLDITYMGVVPAARRRGLGAALVQRAIDATRAASRPRVTCAVDASNLPAIKTYARFHFRALDTKRVFLALPEGSTKD